VLGGNNGLIAVGEGLADVQMTQRLMDRAAAAEGTPNTLSSILGRVTVLAAGGMLTLGGLLGAGTGALFMLLSRQGNTTSSATMASLIVQGPSILLTGLIGAAIGLFTVGATAGLWVWYVLAPPLPDPAVVQSMGAAVAWNEKEAADVVAAHNARLDAASPHPATETAPAPPAAPETVPPPQDSAPTPPSPEATPPPADAPAPATAAPTSPPPPPTQP
jgi:hypothetical protein